MTTNQDITRRIIAALTTSPMPTREIVRCLNSQQEHKSCSKTDINRMLYRRSDIFESEGYSPPVWSLRRTHPTIAPAPSPSLDICRPAEKALYRWQEEAIWALDDNGDIGIVEAVTGTGKSLLAIEYLRPFLDMGYGVLILVPSAVLLKQWCEVVRTELGIEVVSTLGGPKGNRFDRTEQITIGVINSVVNFSDELEREFHVIVADEVHRYATETFKGGLFEDIEFRLGLTATLCRSDGGIDEILIPYFQSIVYRYDYTRAKADRVIAPYAIEFIPVELSDDDRVEYESLGKSMSKARLDLVANFGYPQEIGEFIAKCQVRGGKSQKEGILCSRFLSAMQGRRLILSESPEKLATVAYIARSIGVSKGALAFCETKAGAVLWSQNLNREGIKSDFYHSGMSPQERESVLEDLTSGALQCVVAVHALDEGVDLPEVDCGIIIASSRQKRQMIQRMGRVVRRKRDGRKALFIVVYAVGTAEDPHSAEEKEGYMDVLIENADEVISRRGLLPNRAGR